MRDFDLVLMSRFKPDLLRICYSHICHMRKNTLFMCNLPLSQPKPWSKRARFPPKIPNYPPTGPETALEHPPQLHAILKPISPA